MRVVDTSAWIEAIVKGRPGSTIAKEIPTRELCVVPTIVQLELAKWLVREAGQELASEVIAYTQKCIVIGLNTQIALHAADLCLRHKLPTADAIIYATALDHGAELLTCDAHFEGLDDVLYLRKEPGRA